MIIKTRLGLESSAPRLAEGELFFCIDTYDMLIGTSTGNRVINIIKKDTRYRKFIKWLVYIGTRPLHLIRKVIDYCIRRKD